MKTIIIDDRKERKHQHWNNEKKALAEMLCQKGLLEICEELEGLDKLEECSIIAIHESYLKETDQREVVINYAKEKQKLLVLFSGGITHNGLYESGRLLKINSADFYLKVLSFISDNASEHDELLLLRFLYGSNWRLPLLLRYKNLIWMYGNVDDIDPENDDFSEEEEIRTLLFPGADALSVEWINDQLKKYREAAL